MKALSKWMCTLALLCIFYQAQASCVATYLVHRINGVVVERELLYVTCSDDPTLSPDESGGGSTRKRCTEKKILGSAHKLGSTCDIQGIVGGSVQSGGFKGYVNLRSKQLDFSRHTSGYKISCTSMKIDRSFCNVHTWKPYGSSMKVLADFEVSMSFVPSELKMLRELTFGMVTLGDKWNRSFHDVAFYMNQDCFIERN